MTELNANTPLPLVPEPLPPSRGHLREIWRQFRTHRGAMVGLVVFVLILLFVPETKALSIASAVPSRASPASVSA